MRCRLRAEDVRIVGTIGDFRLWIDQYRDKWRFRINELLFAGFSLFVAMLSVLAGNDGGTGQDLELSPCANVKRLAGGGRER